MSTTCKQHQKLTKNPSKTGIGEVAERPIVQHWKCCVRETGPRVRIPPSPLFFRFAISCFSETAYLYAEIAKKNLALRPKAAKKSAGLKRTAGRTQERLCSPWLANLLSDHQQVAMKSQSLKSEDVIRGRLSVVTSTYF